MCEEDGRKIDKRTMQHRVMRYIATASAIYADASRDCTFRSNCTSYIRRNRRDIVRIYVIYSEQRVVSTSTYAVVTSFDEIARQAQPACR